MLDFCDFCLRRLRAAIANLKRTSERVHAIEMVGANEMEMQSKAFQNGKNRHIIWNCKTTPSVDVPLIATILRFSFSSAARGIFLTGILIRVITCYLLMKRLPADRCCPVQ